MQQLNWQSGDIYKTDSGVEMEILVSAQMLEAFDSDRQRHQFDLDGKDACKCGHGDLKSRVTGSVA